MPKVRNLTDQKFGRLTAIEPTKKRRRHQIVWRCKCECGGELLVAATYLIRGDSRSCGCLKKENGQRIARLSLIARNKRKKFEQPILIAARAAVAWAHENGQVTGMPGMNNTDLFRALVDAVDAERELL
jgi:hypothetical protein